MTNKFIYFSIFFLLVIKLIAVYFTQFSLYGDEAQYWLWSQSPDLGYYSKPPLLAWFLSAYSFIFSDSFFALKVFPIVIYLFIGFGIYHLCLKLSINKKDSILCSVSFLIIPAASLSSFLISTDLLLLLFWSLAMGTLLEIRKKKFSFKFFFY